MSTTTFRALDTVVLVDVDGDDSLSATVDAMIGACPRSDNEPAVRYRIDAMTGTLLRDDEVLRANVPGIDLPIVFETDLHELAVARARDSFLVHAAALAGRNGVLLMVAQSGGGKTTMTRALLERGAHYITDETSAIDRDALVRGLPRPLALVREGTDASELAQPTTLGAVTDYPWRVPGGGIAHHRILVPARDRVAVTPAPLAAIVMLQYAPHEPRGLTRLGPTAALQAIWGQNRRADAAGLDIAIELVQRFPVQRLVTHSVATACDDLAAVWTP